MAKTMFLPGFSHQLLGRPAAAATGKIQRRAHRLDGLAALVARFVPKEVFTPGEGGRQRLYTPWLTFIAFLGQVLSRGSACREAVRRVQAWCVAERRTVPDENSSAYCQARGRLTVETLRAAHEELGGWIERHSKDTWRWRHRVVKVLDGCGVSMPDSAANRAEWPYAGGQKPDAVFRRRNWSGCSAWQRDGWCVSRWIAGKRTRFRWPDS
jgi:hypothetical protein